MSAASAEGATTNALFNALANRDADSFNEHLQEVTSREKEALGRVFTAVGEIKGLSGTLVYLAAHDGREGFLRLMKDSSEEHFNSAAITAVQRLVTMLRYDGAQMVLRVSPTLGHAIEPVSGTNVLHVACSRQRTDLDFVRFLTTLPSFDVNLQDAAGKTPLHLVAERSRGVHGRDAVKALLALGADRTRKDNQQRTPAQSCRNPHAHALLCEGGQPMRHRKSLPPIDDATRSVIYDADVSEFPELPVLDVSAVTAAPADQSRVSTAGSSTSKSASKILSADDLGNMIQRVYTEAIATKQRNTKQALDKIIKHDEDSRKLRSADEIAETVTRLYETELETREARKEAVRTKYIKEPEERKTLSQQEVSESVMRQTNDVMTKKRAVLETLTKKYAPEPEPRSLSAEEEKALAQRLHDESRKQAAASMAKLEQQYLHPDKGRFAGSKKMTKQEWATMGDRLCKKA